MKKCTLLLVVLLIVFSSCVSRKYPYTSGVSFIDYSELMNKGLFVTESNSVNFDYKPIGSVHVEVRSGYIERNDPSRSQKNKAKVRTAYSKDKDNIQKPPKLDYYVVATIDEAQDLLLLESKNRGANGLIGMKIGTLDMIYTDKNIAGSGVYISGMFIYR